MSVLVLQTLACERRASRGSADEESPRLQIAARPGEVTDALEPEHRVIDVERDHLDAVVRVRRPGGEPRAERPRLVDTFLENLALLVFLVEHELIGVLRGIELPHRGVNSDLPEHPFHAERTCLVRHDRHDVRADVLIADERRQNPHERHRR